MTASGRPRREARKILVYVDELVSSEVDSDDDQSRTKRKRVCKQTVREAVTSTPDAGGRVRAFVDDVPSKPPSGYYKNAS